jgi:hypothetical protein
MKEKYEPIEISDNGVAEMLSATRPTAQTSYAAYLEQPITAEGLYTALTSGGHKSPESDGISREFYMSMEYQT